MIWFITVDGVLRECAGSPSIDASHTMHIQVDVQIHEAATLNLVRMSSLLEVFFAIIPGTDAEGLTAVDA